MAHPAPAPAPLDACDAGGEAPELVEDELLVEEISIDGMCGVY
jgi:mycofactocin precursor